MYRIVLYLVTTTLAAASMQVHRVFISGRSGTNIAPTTAGYTYTQVDKNPGTVSRFGTYKTRQEPVLENYSALKHHAPTLTATAFSKEIHTPAMYESLMAKRDLDYVISQSKADLNSKFLPSKTKTDLMYEKLKSAMHYLPNDAHEMISHYDISEYHNDDEDVRTGSRSSYDSWPSYNPYPYHYNHMKINTETEKAKDKRYAVDAAKVIPIHEDLADDIPNSYEPVLNTPYYHSKNYDYRDDSNPISGHEPFFSFVLSDYYDKSPSDDLFSFKGLNWKSDVESDKQLTPPKVHDDYYVRNRRLNKDLYLPEYEHGSGTTISQSHHGDDNIKAVHGDAITEKGFVNKNNFDKHEQGDSEKVNDKVEYEKKNQKHTAFKDFMDTFSNRFGAEDHKKDSKFSLKRNQDNSEKRKGFHRVYHKDEYQEDKEFYNNNNNSVRAEDNGSSNAHVGGSEGLLASHASTASGNQLNSSHLAGDKEKNRIENNNSGHNNSQGFDEYFNRYRDIAKQTAQSNNADYSDSYFRS